MSEALRSTAIVVVSYASAHLLRTHLVAVADSAPGVQVVVVDNWTTSEERAAVEQLCAEQGWTAICSDTNLGFGGGVNLGATAALEAGADVLVLLNPDASVDGASLGRMIDRVRHDPWAMRAPRIVRSDGSLWFDGIDLWLSDGHMSATRNRPAGTDETEVVPWLTGACLVLSRQLWQRLDGFDEEYFLYWEDVDLSHRALASGASIAVDHDCTAVHDEGGSQTSGSGARDKSDLYYYFNIRNRLLFAAKNLDAGTQRRWRRTSTRAAYDILLRGGRRHLLSRRGPAPTAVRATLHGRRALRRTGG
ncbi:glycosyltransferase family 2 protein [Luteipulveratus halotolerans]|uniref:Glycosyltransferase 2-like domain-containing protein n=1 Tax=Luteipulveratus halotolerans TaxID=1631356 RepID=A0A0L6CJP0_9MICO|nr:glycosyltransferase family 2 protein [Luteipulveratus halotolerans]KNX38006.1 hypothetical protein VV01_13975 [Luteipulveratus halotolerans]